MWIALPQLDCIVLHYVDCTTSTGLHCVHYVDCTTSTGLHCVALCGLHYLNWIALCCIMWIALPQLDCIVCIMWIALPQLDCIVLHYVDCTTSTGLHCVALCGL